MPRRNSPLDSAKCLAVFGGHDRGEFVEVLFKQRLELEEKLHAIDGRSGAPRGEGGVSGLDRSVHFCLRNRPVNGREVRR